MAKYLKITVSGPWVNMDRVIYMDVEDEFDPDNNEADEKFADEQTREAVWDYVEAGYDVVDEDEVPEDER